MDNFGAKNSIMIASLIGAGVSVASSLGGAVMSAIQANNAKKNLERQKAENEAEYNRLNAQDYTKRSDAQAIIKKQRELLNERYKNARATNAVAGGNDSALAAMQAGDNASLSSTMTNIAANASSYKDGLRSQYWNNKKAIDNQIAQKDEAQAQAIAQAAGQAVKAGTSLIGAGVDKKALQSVMSDRMDSMADDIYNEVNKVNA